METWVLLLKLWADTSAVPIYGYTSRDECEKAAVYALAIDHPSRAGRAVCIPGPAATHNETFVGNAPYKGIGSK